MEREVKKLSASRIKNLKSCSWSYWCKYHLKLPEKQNSGAERGTVCHLVFELLLNKRHRKHFDTLMKMGNIASSASIERLVRKHMVASQTLMDDEVENYKLIDEMILVGLNHDFFCKGIELFAPEEAFTIVNEDPEYVARGFIDKWGKKKKKKIIKVMDYKSSKKRFEGDELASNIQGMLYSIAAQKQFPDHEVEVEFIFLKFPEDPSQKVKFNKQTLEGFEMYLEGVNKTINNYTYSHAISGFASKKGFPPKEKGFSGKLLCGFASKPGELKKDGNPKWHCPFKFSYDYYVLMDNKGKWVKSAFEKKDLAKAKKGKRGWKIDKRHYGGCPAYAKTSLTNF